MLSCIVCYKLTEFERCVLPPSSGLTDGRGSNHSLYQTISKKTVILKHNYLHPFQKESLQDETVLSIRHIVMTSCKIFCENSISRFRVLYGKYSAERRDGHGLTYTNGRITCSSLTLKRYTLYNTCAIPNV